MSKGGAKPGSPDRPVTKDEAELWDYATRSLERVQKKPRVTPGTSSSSAPPAKPHPVDGDKQKKDAPKASAPAPAKRIPPARPAPLADFDRRKARQIGTGKIKLDARIDLHGLRESEARGRLRAFLRDAHAEGLRTVLVITGKGRQPDPRDHLARALGEPERGVLRRSVPQWLEEPDLRAIVMSYTAAGVRHGGDGALYVQLRKAPGADTSP